MNRPGDAAHTRAVAPLGMSMPWRIVPRATFQRLQPSNGSLGQGAARTAAAHKTKSQLQGSLDVQEFNISTGRG
jgi:hypothetical protein